MNNDLLASVEASRIVARAHISEEEKKLQEQYFTPARISLIMANMFSARTDSEIKVLDPCCGVGNLAAAIFETGSNRSENQNLTLIERDLFLFEKSTVNFSGVPNAQIKNADFFDIIDSLGQFDRIIINPPYSKTKPSSKEAKICKEKLNYSDTNIYSIFISLSLSLLSNSGELVAIIPRSFCNGPLFKGFRTYISRNFHINEFYSFDTRKIFSDSKVQQEVIIVKISRCKSSLIKITHEKSDGETITFLSLLDRVIFPNDPNQFIHIPLAKGDDELLAKVAKFPNTLASIGLQASTGKIVDFRNEENLFFRKSNSRVYLVYQDAVQPFCYVNMSADNALPRHIEKNSSSSKNLLPKGNYILVRRISFKESKTRIIASPLPAEQFDKDYIGVENHLNYIWARAGDMGKAVCVGLYAYFSTHTVDKYVRRFSGHTQINATDINSLPVPEVAQLEAFYHHHHGLLLDELAVAAEVYFFGQTPETLLPGA